MEIVQGVCIFCTENDSVLSDENKIYFLNIIKINFFSNNRFNFSEVRAVIIYMHILYYKIKLDTNVFCN